MTTVDCRYFMGSEPGEQSEPDFETLQFHYWSKKNVLPTVWLRE